MVLLIPDAVRKIKAQGRAEGYAEGLAEARAERYEENLAKGRQEARQIIWDAVLEYRRREGIGIEEPLPVPVILNIIDDAFARHDAARNVKTNACCR